MLKKLFAPGDDSFLTDVALLVLRVWLGLSMLINHGLGKLQGFKTMAAEFPDPFGVGHSTSLALVVFAEFFASILLAIGLVTRFAALVLVVNMTVAFFLVHKGALSGPQSGELAFIYLAGYVGLLLAGAGRISVDRYLFQGGSKRTASAK
ncbi:MAG TPA: DoxX family protein [Clostridia bacterium]|nr:DoxX family protein [Clostridia bacterium]